MATGLVMPAGSTTHDQGASAFRYQAHDKYDGAPNNSNNSQLFYTPNVAANNNPNAMHPAVRSRNSSLSNNYYYHHPSPTVPEQSVTMATPALATPNISTATLRSARPSLATTPSYSPLSNPAFANNLASPFAATVTSSPTSPRSSYHARHVRPLYMPAVLRPNLYPSKAAPARCCRKDSRDQHDPPETDSFLNLRRHSAVLLSAINLRLGRRPPEKRHSLNEEALGRLDLELFPKVSSPPTKKHWKPDSESSVCDQPSCLRAFSYINRRHHCRRCGNIFCDPHSAHTVPLDEDAKFNPRGSPSRACAHCFREFRSWRSRNNSLASSTASSEAGLSTGSVSMPPTPTSSGIAMPTAAASPTSSHGDSTDDVLAAGPGGANHALAVASSVPRDWNWSTF